MRSLGALVSTWISSTLEVMGVPVTTQAWRRQSADTMMAATLDDCATSCASSSTTRQNPNCSSSDLPRNTFASALSRVGCPDKLRPHYVKSTALCTCLRLAVHATVATEHCIHEIVMLYGVHAAPWGALVLCSSVNANCRAQAVSAPGLEAELLAQGLVGHEHDVAVVQEDTAAVGLGALQGRDRAGERVAGVRGGAGPLGAPTALSHDVPIVVLYAWVGILAVVDTPTQDACMCRACHELQGLNTRPTLGGKGSCGGSWCDDTVCLQFMPS